MKKILICSHQHLGPEGSPVRSYIAQVARDMNLDVVDLLPYFNGSDPLPPTLRHTLEEAIKQGLDPVLVAPSNVEQAAWGKFLRASGVKHFGIATITNDDKPGWQSRIKEQLQAALEGRPAPVFEEEAVLSVELEGFTDMKVEKVNWLVPHLVPRGRYTLLCGSGGSGKSSWTVALAAALSRGLYGGSPTRCLIVNLEDDPASVTLPRLAMNGADMDQVFCLKLSRGFGLNQVEEVRVLLNREKTAGRPFGLVVVDPLGRLIKGGSTKDDGLIWEMADALDRMARETDAAVVACAHPRKGARAGGTVRRDHEAVSGSAALVNSTRSTLLMSVLKDGRRFVGQVKSNYGRPHFLEVRERDLRDWEKDTIDPKTLEAAASVGASRLEWTYPQAMPVGVDFEDVLQGFEDTAAGGELALPTDTLVEVIVEALKICPMPKEELATALFEYAPRPAPILSELKNQGVRWAKEPSPGIKGGGPWWLWVPGGRPFSLMTDEERTQARASVAKALGDAVGRKRESLDQTVDQDVDVGWYSAWSPIEDMNKITHPRIVAK